MSIPNNITTGFVLARAKEKERIDEQEGNHIWAAMLARRRKLPTESFTNYLRTLYPRDQAAATVER